MHFKVKAIVLLVSVLLLSLAGFSQIPVTVKESKPTEAQKPVEPKGPVTKGPAVPQKYKGTIFFETTNFNFNRIEEESGINYTTFAFANIGKGDLKVLDVHASCGCTSPQWSKSVIKPNETGYLKVGFSPKGQAGHFSKSLTVTTNGDPAVVYLEISGEVVGETQSWYVRTPQTQGNTRVTGNLITFKNVKDSRIDSILFNLFNSSKNDIDILGVSLPSYLKAKVVRNILPAGTGTNIWLYFMPRSGAKYGLNEDEMVINTTDDSLAVKRFLVRTNVEQDFDNVSPELRKRPPALKYKETVKDFGEIYLSEVVSYDFEVTNTGKGDLTIWRAYGSCGCTVASVPAIPIKKGKTGKISITLNAKNLYEHVEKQITVISNDPKHPVTTLAVKAYVVDPSRK